ncbi:hypothetical protein K437DRAFT_256163 [Tilletiaria anomala UBC 951]|uniref:Uncharacterized protein n=1 Tax=Tilletiaria anomala (strain ATCC 24038 / CBS 436.72 / UBC 951) TaxID=1037660 RepID=A0A066W1L8_TILAU|nr:uncharacterized protein K437DRAFT_256163 [Tilletiaria anomala UBC 951]KDN46438.1 hypothetical protein K437DRAFT_256163 [Tilletiaria anomala UBC 951]
MAPIRTTKASSGIATGGSSSIDIKSPTTSGIGVGGALCLPGDPIHRRASAHAPYSRSPPTSRLSTSPSSIARLSTSPSGSSAAIISSLSSSPLADTNVIARHVLETLEQRALAVTGHATTTQAAVEASSSAPAPTARGYASAAASSSLFIPKTSRVGNGVRASKDPSQMSSAELLAAITQRSSLLSSAGTSVSPAISDKLRAEVVVMQNVLASRNALRELGDKLHRATIDPESRDEKELQDHLQAMSLLRKGKGRAVDVALDDDFAPPPPPPQSHREVKIKAISNEEADAIQRQVWEFEQDQIREASEAAQRSFRGNADHNSDDNNSDRDEQDPDWDDALQMD